MLHEKSLCEFVTVVSRGTGSSSMLNKIANHAYKAHAEWLKHFDTPWESEGYNVESQTGQLRLTWNLILASLGTFIIAEQEIITWEPEHQGR